MNNDNESKIKQILSELPDDKRKILKDHIDELSGKEREDFLNEVITEYESLKNKSVVSFTDAAKKLSQAIEPAVKEANLEDVLKQPINRESEPEVRPEDISFDIIPSENEPTAVLDNFEKEDITLEHSITEMPYTGEMVSEEDNEETSDLPAVKETRESRKPQRADVSPFINDEMPKKKKPVGAIIAGVAAALIVCGGLLYAFVLSKNPSFQAFTSKLGIPVATKAEETTTTVTETSALPTPTPEPIPTTESTEAPSPTPTEVPTPTPMLLKENAPDLKGIKVVIDPGHQEKTDYKKEPFKKGTTNGKARCTSGATGITTKQKEYELTLDTALMLKEYLEKCGATVILTRTENNVNISNKERAAIAVKAKPTLFLRLHADASTNASVKGVRVYIPKSGKLNKTADANRLGKLVAAAGKTTFRGSKATNQYTGLNFAASIRSYQIVLGYLSNTDDDARLADVENRYEMCAAIATFCKSFKKK